MTAPLLSLQDACVSYRQGQQLVPAVRHVDLVLNEGETLGIVGESGCGKSTLALLIMGLLPQSQAAVSGRLMFDGHVLSHATEETWRAIRGRQIAMIFQDPFSSLNPVMTIQEQVMECGLSKIKSIHALEQVQMNDPERILKAYPHQLSGGQRQRVMIAIALARRPKLLIADEPTTALDVTVQADIIDLLEKLQKEMGMALLFVTHNMGLVKSISHNLAVMYSGEIVEMGKTSTVLSRPKHPYSKGLIGAAKAMSLPHKAGR